MIAHGTGQEGWQSAKERQIECEKCYKGGIVNVSDDESSGIEKSAVSKDVNKKVE